MTALNSLSKPYCESTVQHVRYCAPLSARASRHPIPFLSAMPDRKESIQVPLVLTIAGSDSGGGAGIQADLKTLAANGVFGLSAVTALTAQNTHGVSGIEQVSADFVSKQIETVLSDFTVKVLKTGLLANVSIVRAVAAQIRKHRGIQLVVDPVLVATSGDSLASLEVGKAIADLLFPLATLVTPNMAEASSLLGGDPVNTVEEMKAAARKLHALGPQVVLVKGGHLYDADASNNELPGGAIVADVVFDGKNIEVLQSARVETSNTHGTGCTTASAVAAYLARGFPVMTAIQAARSYVVEALRRSAHLQIGTGLQRPFNHLFAIDDWSSSKRLKREDLRLYAVTDPTCNEQRNRTNSRAVELALDGGATIVQLREKNSEGGAFCREAERVLRITRHKGVKLLINDRIDVALAVGADGVHIGQDDISAQHARQLLGPEKVLGVSVKSVEQAQQAERDGADYLGAGAMFQTATKKSSTISFETLREICEAVEIPVVAIGGLDAANAKRCIEAGCAGVAVVSAIFGAESPALSARQIISALDGH